MYKHILFAVEFDTGTDKHIEQVKQLIEICCPLKASLVHVVELPSYYIYPNLPQKEQDAYCIELAASQLTNIGEKLSVPANDQHVIVGYPKEVILFFIKQQKVDLLIVGHHTRHGIYHLLGSTAYALLSNATYQVLVLPYPSYE